MFSFKNGMQSLPKALAGILGDKVILNTSVTKVEKLNGRYTVSALSSNKEKKYECDILISAIPSYNAAVIFEDEKILSEHLNAIYYPPVLVLYLAYRKKDIGQPLDGFGFLIPEKEKKSFSGGNLEFCPFPRKIR
jgi:protoporphyrinogen/coproporphyrinogen III oxidase